MRVDPDPQWLWIWRAWHRLSSERHEAPHGIMMPMGGGLISGRPRQIPWSSVRLWAEHHGMSMQEMALLDRCIVLMDEVFIRRWVEKQERQRAS
ncbi:hypothetical protein A0U94_06600 [Gluconobacter albidus]|uniref:hypothetical protein n=1 Tax=Gluconobacter albidus TaxID=318683 RepID=UPI00098B7005|nr:hypothetical protein [Gluconobacter albidus]AQS90691.1 hypothetical protein A0U94_06600 [Gluconobacter albidus]